MKKTIFSALFILSIAINLTIFGKWLIFDWGYAPSREEEIILSEMVRLTVESEDYQKIEQKENIIAIEPSIDKRKGGVYPFYFEVSVRTDTMTHIFSCKDKSCARMEEGGLTYSIYEDESPRLPMKN